ncbi:MAG: phosphate signaling complex protein PhoU [Phycisphaerales bacterium]|nr:phosphate signaling complex protein PhoU [Phycisphaerales bacterium]
MAIDLHKELLLVRRELLHMGAMVEQRVRSVFEALETGDVDLAKQVKSGDHEIDEQDIQIETECLRVLALASPVAGDLRFVLGAMRIDGQLERVGDLARSIAKRVIRLNILPAVEFPSAIFDMARAVQAMLADALAALTNEDSALCHHVLHADQRVDDLRKEVFAWARTEIPAHLEATQAIIDILSVAQKMERMGDMAHGIAADVIFMVEGNIVRHMKT